MNITEFMKLPDNEKELYINRVYPLANSDKSEYEDYDIGIFDTSWGIGISKKYNLCELCPKDTPPHKKYIGTGDTREPKFCFKHYAEINKDSDFIKEV